MVYLGDVTRVVEPLGVVPVWCTCVAWWRSGDGVGVRAEHSSLISCQYLPAIMDFFDAAAHTCQTHDVSFQHPSPNISYRRIVV